MLNSLQSLWTLRWRQQPPQYRPLPPHIERTFVPTPSGDLELLISRPKQFNTSPSRVRQPPVLFVHGGFGSAGVWLEWMTYLHESGYNGILYACSLRNHGASYSVPFWKMVWQTPLEACATDLLACLKHAKADAGEDLVLIGHSSGGGLSQYVLSKGECQARALCLVDAIPHFGSFDVYWNWFKQDPWFPMRSWLHLQHPTSPLSSVSLVHGAFFGSRYPRSRVPEFMRWMPAYESMRWPMGMTGNFGDWWRGRCTWLEPRSILKSIARPPNERNLDRVCIVVGSEDMMMDLGMCRRQAAEYREANSEAERETEPLSVSYRRGNDEMIDGVRIEKNQGVRLVVVEGAGHHSQNDVQCESGAEALRQWLTDL